MEIRQARISELEYLKQRIKESGGEEVALDSARVWVAIEGETIIGVLPLRMIWQAEPLLLFPEVATQMQRRRAGLMLYRAMEAWVADRMQNRTGIYWFLAVTRAECVKKWLLKLGWIRQYIGAESFIKYV